MFKHNLLYKTLVAASILASTAIVNAEEVSVSASVTVSNAFDLSVVSNLDFGTIRATQTLSGSSLASGTAAGVRVLADGSGSEVIEAAGLTTGDSSDADIIVPGAPAEFLIENAAGNSSMQLTIPTTPTEIYEVGTTTPAIFSLTFQTSDVRVKNADTTEVAYNGNNLTTNDTGTVGFLLGGSLTIADDVDGDLEDTSYIGSFDVTVQY